MRYYEDLKTKFDNAEDLKDAYEKDSIIFGAKIKTRTNPARIQPWAITISTSKKCLALEGKKKLG